MFRGSCFMMNRRAIWWQSGKHSHLSPLRSEFESWPNLKWESWWLLAVGQQFTVQSLDQLYVLVSSAHKTTARDMTYTVLKVMLISQ